MTGFLFVLVLLAATNLSWAVPQFEGTRSINLPGLERDAARKIELAGRLRLELRSEAGIERYEFMRDRDHWKIEGEVLSLSDSIHFPEVAVAEHVSTPRGGSRVAIMFGAFWGLIAGGITGAALADDGHGGEFLGDSDAFKGGAIGAVVGVTVVPIAVMMITQGWETVYDNKSGEERSKTSHWRY
jgi:hypothetical protein